MSDRVRTVERADVVKETLLVAFNKDHDPQPLVEGILAIEGVDTASDGDDPLIVKMNGLSSDAQVRTAIESLPGVKSVVAPPVSAYYK